MNDYRKYFTSFIRSHYPEEGERLIARTDHHYRIISKDVLFAKTSKNPIDRRLDFSAYFLALIKTLDEITSSLAGLQLIRTDTIARGAEKCDFRFKLQGKDHKQSLTQ